MQSRLVDIDGKIFTGCFLKEARPRVKETVLRFSTEELHQMYSGKGDFQRLIAIHAYCIYIQIKKMHFSVEFTFQTWKLNPCFIYTVCELALALQSTCACAGGANQRKTTLCAATISYLGSMFTRLILDGIGSVLQHFVGGTDVHQKKKKKRQT